MTFWDNGMQTESVLNGKANLVLLKKKKKIKEFHDFMFVANLLGSTVLLRTVTRIFYQIW